MTTGAGATVWVPFVGRIVGHVGAMASSALAWAARLPPRV